MSRRFWLGLGGVALIGLGAFYFLGSRPPEAEPEFEIVTVEQGTLVATVSASGQVTAREDTSLSFGTSGLVTEILVEEGQKVEERQTLAQLDIEDLELQRIQAEASLKQAELTLADVLHPYTQEDIDQAQGAVRDAQVALETAQLQLLVTENSPETTSHIRDLEEIASWYQNNYQEKLEEFNHHKIDQAQLDKHYNNWQTAEENLEVAKNQAAIDLKTADNNVAQAEDNLAQAQSDLEEVLAGADPDEVAKAQAESDRAQASLDQIQLQSERSNLVAPFAGTVAEIIVEEGETVSPGTPVLRLLDASVLPIEIAVDEVDIGQVKIRQKATVTFEALPALQLTGKVEFIAPAATVEGGVVTYKVRIGLERIDPGLRVGMTADVEIEVQRVTGILLPNRAVQVDRETGRFYVEKVTPTGSEPVAITPGATNDSFTQILDGLAQGDEIIIRPISGRELFQGAFSLGGGD